MALSPPPFVLLACGYPVNDRQSDAFHRACITWAGRPSRRAMLATVAAEMRRKARGHKVVVGGAS